MENTFVSFAFGCRVNQAEKEELDIQMVASGFVNAETRDIGYIFSVKLESLKQA